VLFRSVNQLMKDVSVLVNEQQSALDSIEGNVEATAVHVTKGNQDLRKANQHQKNKPKAHVLLSYLAPHCDHYHCCRARRCQTPLIRWVKLIIYTQFGFLIIFFDNNCVDSLRRPYFFPHFQISIFICV